jgi:mannitol-specific phosphotransferase system IIBC component
VTPKDGYVGVLLAIAVAAVVSFGAASMLLSFGRAEKPVVDAPPAGAPATLTPTGA